MAAWLFARALSLIYLIAFVSIGVQVRGLIGANGILPAENFVHIVDRYFGAKKFVSLPSVFLFGVNDQLLVLVCAAGAVCALLAFAGVAQSLMFLLMWALYLSLVNVSQDFLSFQWDVLLLEAGFLAIFLAPVTAVDLNPAAAFFKAHEPPRLVYWLFLFLLFRFMFASGAVKLASGDETWRNLTAMSYHYETQPIPNPLAWLAHQLPLWAQKLSCAAMFAIELAVPFLIFVPGRARLLAFGSLVALQTLILATGNYAFFNWLTIALCLFLLPEPFLARWLEPLHSRLEVAPPPAWHAYLSLPFGILVGTLGLAWLLSALFPSLQLRKGLHALMSPFAGFHISNPYGLFAVMTTERPEIIIEGSEDGRNWKAYEFKYKPGRLDRAPPFVAPHQPRLDWQMWFAALGSYENNRWIQNLLVRLLKNEKSVIALLAENPFSEKPPRMIRASLYKYNFAASGSGDWWVREPRGDYSPTLERTGDD